MLILLNQIIKIIQSKQNITKITHQNLIKWRKNHPQAATDPRSVKSIRMKRILWTISASKPTA